MLLGKKMYLMIKYTNILIFHDGIHIEFPRALEYAYGVREGEKAVSQGSHL